MKKVPVIKYRFVSFGASLLFIALGVIFAIVFKGFNAGIDFGSGYSEKIQIAPVGLYVSYQGGDDYVLNVSSGTLVLDKRNANGVESVSFPASIYPDTSSLAAALEAEGLSVKVADSSLSTAKVVSGFSFPKTLDGSFESINFATESKDVSIEMLRSALEGLGNVNVQVVGNPSDGVFQIRLATGEGDTQKDMESKVSLALSKAFGEDEVVVMQSDFVGPKFSSQLLISSIKAILIAIFLILIYITIRFRVAYAVSSIIALFHDVLCMLSLMLIFRLEVSTTTIAAVLTIIGYSLNNTIVIFDRIRERIRLEKNADVDDVIEESVRMSLTRTIITSLTTLFAIVPLAFFATGDIKLFAINLTWGILVGGYSSNFIAPALLHYFHKIWPINIEKEKEEEYSLVD